MKKHAIVILFITFLCILTSTHGQWQKYVIDNDINNAVSVDVADMDGDTKPDLIVTNEGGHELIWYQNDFPYWIKHTIDKTGVSFAYCGDIDGDDTLDVVASHLNPREMVWYKNNHPTWTKHYIDANPDGSNFMLVADFDNDDKPDVVTAGGYAIGGDVVWYENNHPDWTTHIIESGANKYASLNVCDVDDDGLLDVVATMYAANKVVWFRNEDNGLSWTKYSIDESFNYAFGLNSGDIDGNNTTDIVATTSSESEVAWYENHHPTWTKHIIDANLTGARWPHVADVDGDDTMEVIVGGTSVVWYKNNHPVWTKHLIDADLNSPNLLTFTDMDGDNIKDVIVTSSSSLTWYKNPNTTVAYATSLEVSPTYILPHTNDTLTIKVSVSNPEAHAITVEAKIRGVEHVYQDSIQLYDDGFHEDGENSDYVYGNKIGLSDLAEDRYSVELSVCDHKESSTHYLLSGFSTIGPVVFEKYSFTADDTIPNPDDRIKLYVTLKNNGPTVSATNIEAELISLDPLAEVTERACCQNYDDIAPGAIIQSDRPYYIDISADCPVGRELPFELEINSGDYTCWTDTFSITVQAPPDKIEYLGEPIARIYPNPATDQLTIEFDESSSVNTSIKLFDITGKEVYSEIIDNTPTHTINLSSFRKGLYLINISNDKYSITEKVIKVE